MVRTIQESFRTHPWAVLITLLYLVMGVVFSVVNPIHEATDELRHYRYVRYIADLGQLPVQSDSDENAQAHHPPLYYATAALASFWVHPPDPLYDPPANPHWGYRYWEVGTDNKNLQLHGPDEAWPYHGHALAAHIARWVTLLWGAGTVALTYAIALTLFPNKKSIACAAALLIALDPMFLYLGAAVNNDVPAALVGAAITLVAVRVMRDGLTTRRMIALGVWYGLASLVKFNLVAMLGVIELALVLHLVLNSKSAIDNNQHPAKKWAVFLKANAIILGMTLLLCGWWYVRNTVLYGEPTGFIRLTEIWGFRDPGAGVQLAGRELVYAWTSLWGRFGYGQIPLPDGFYITMAVVCGLGLIGLVGWLVVRRKDFTPRQWGMVGLLAASVLVNFAVLYAYITISPAGAMGRFFFPGLPAFVTLVAVGLVGFVPERGQFVVPVVTGGLMFGLTLLALVGYLAPAYAIPDWVEPPDESFGVVAGDVARILSYDIAPDEVRPGEPIDVTVTWEVLRPTDQPYMVFIHVLGEHGALITQRDTYTGLGNYPSNFWQPGHVFTETYRVYLPETAYAPDKAQCRLGLYHPERGRLDLAVEDTGRVFGNELWSRKIAVLDDPAHEYPNQVYINWDNRFALVGYKIEPRILLQGQKTLITLYWLAIDPPRGEDYKVFLQIMKGWDGPFASNDGAPVHPDIQTRYWEPGKVYVDERSVRLPGDLPPDFYDIHLGWFSDTDGGRLNIIAEDGHIIDNWLMLNTISVRANE
jgi:hypothetical protein